MIAKKHNGKIYGASFTANEKKAMEMEIKRQLSNYLDNINTEIVSAILWVLHEQFEFGPKRLKRFYDSFDKELKKLTDKYEMDKKDQYWLCSYKLKELGVDVEKWNTEGK